MTRPPILCISANPAIDRRLRINRLALGKVNRAQSADALPGGKAAHVAMSAKALGARAVWLGFVGGATGEAVVKGLRELEIEVVPIQTRSSTRVNFELIEDCGRVTEVLEPGAAPDEKERSKMASRLAEGLSAEWNGAPVVISGSLPLGTPPEFYKEIIEVAHANGSLVLLDTSGDSLRVGLEAKPDLIKPNRSEAEALLGRSISGFDSAIVAARDAIGRGASSAAVTLGAEGLIWLESGNGPAWIARPPQLRAISTVACGDATIAGFAFAFLEALTGEKAVRLAAACGAANCLAQLEGRISRSDVEALIPQIQAALG